jgi:hypothetical protein
VKTVRRRKRRERRQRRNSLCRKRIESQLAKIQIGINIVVKIIKNNEIPSNPNNILS